MKRQNNFSLVIIIICIGIILFLLQRLNERPNERPNERQMTREKDHSTVVYIKPNYAQSSSYVQVGILTPLNGKETNNILPLMGRRLEARRGLWNYYTISNQHNNVKLPISVRGKSALSERGVDEIFNGDSVFVEGVFDAYKATVYDNETMRYMP